MNNHRVGRVQNKSPAEIQITAEQLLREATERLESTPKFIQNKVASPDDSLEIRQIRRKEFEDSIRRNKNIVSTWLKYAKYEEILGELNRARSIYERALEIEPRNIVIWLRYVEMEMQNKNIQLSRNLWNRAVTFLPFIEQFWYKYAYFEEMMGNIEEARQVFERWMQWNPRDIVWGSYIKFEIRHNRIDNIRRIYETLICKHNKSKSWIKYAKFEEQLENISRARKIYEKAIDLLVDNERDSKIFTAFAKFEIKHGELERAREIFKYGIEILTKERREHLEKRYLEFEKQNGRVDEIESLIIDKRKFYYEEKLKENPHNYDVWIDFIRLEESKGSVEKTRDLYERAITCVPDVENKMSWRRFVYIWIFYSVFEELKAKDYERTENIFKKLLSIIPHNRFTFGKVWILYSKFLIRRRQLDQARKVFGRSLGLCFKRNVIRTYIEIEIALKEFDRVRKLYEKYIIFQPSDSSVWLGYADLERALGDIQRSRSILDIAIMQPVMEGPESIWHSYIDLETSEGNIEKVRSLYERLLARTNNIYVWLGYSKIEWKYGVDKSRSIFQRAYNIFKDTNNSANCIELLDNWVNLEMTLSDNDETIENIKSKYPCRLKCMKKDNTTEDSTCETQKKEDHAGHNYMNLLKMAHKWKEENQGGEEY